MSNDSTSEKNTLDHIINHRTIPPTSSWDRIQGKLGKKKAKHKIRLYQKLSIAATFVALISIGALLNHNIEHAHNADVFTTNSLYSPIVLESLPDASDNEFYSIDNFRKLSVHYDRLSPN